MQYHRHILQIRVDCFWIGEREGAPFETKRFCNCFEFFGIAARENGLKPIFICCLGDEFAGVPGRAVHHEPPAQLHPLAIPVYSPCVLVPREYLPSRHAQRLTLRSVVVGIYESALPTSGLGQKQTWADENGMSALLPRADIVART